MAEYDELDIETRPVQPDVDTVIAALREGEDGSKVTATVFYGLSNISESDMARIQPVWERLPADYRHKLVDLMAESSESNFELDYRIFGRYALDDEDAGVREAAIDLLFDDNSLSLMDDLIDKAQWDDSIAVRAAAVSALGRFILAGELGELPERETTRAQDAAVNLLTNEDEDLDVRRRALEAISNSSHEIVPDAITEAYDSQEPVMRYSAVFAMGRTADDVWGDTVTRELNSNDPAMRFEAARSAGELELEDSVPKLVRLAFEDEIEIREVAVWSLGEIGGRDALRALNMLADRLKEEGETEGDLYEAVTDAIANASLVGGDFSFMEFDD